MDKKPKASGAPPKEKQKLDDKEQSERFIATAREVGADENPKKFETVFQKMIPPKRP
jgi:hypothetical protein